jgi:hypothetical protein
MTHFAREDVEFLRAGLVQMDEYYRNNAEFLDRMRHITCFDHVQRVKGFVAEFLSTPQNPEDASSTVRDFVEEMAGMLSDHQLWREDGEDGYAQVSESLEKFLLQRLYNKVFTPLDSKDAEDDNQLYLSTRRLQFITPDHLDIPSRPLNKVAFHLAAEELAKLDSSKFSSPWEKLVCILNSISILSNLLKHYGADEGTGADELLPYIIYTLILLSPKHMYSNLRYVQRFRSESKLRSEAAYYYTQMESAVLFISNADHKSFTISPDDFARGMREGEERLRSGKDVPTFIPRTYLWSRRSATPPKSLPEGAGGNFRQGGGAPPPPVAPGIVDEITREWRQLESSWQQGVAAMNRGRAEPTDKDLLNTRFEDLTVSQLESLHRKYRALLTVQ